MQLQELNLDLILTIPLVHAQSHTRIKSRFFLFRRTMMSSASMFSIFDESINEVPILAASLNQRGAKVESDQSTLYAKVDSGFTEIGAVVIELRG